MIVRLLFHGIFIVPILLMNIHCTIDNGIAKSRTDESIEAAEHGSEWIIKKGLLNYYHDRKNLNKNLKETTEAYLYTKPGINSNGALFTVILEHRWIHALINCCSRITDGKELYEYWTVSYFSATRTDVSYRKIKFIITKTDSVSGERIILKKSDTFIKNYLTENGMELSFPLLNNQLISWIKVWNYPSAFKNSDLEGVKIEYINGKYRKQKGGVNLNQ
jgi:hypothetical protein